MSKKLSYPAPLDRLLKLGEDTIRQKDWLDYREMGITTEHIPELIRISTDPDLLWAPSDSKRVWAPIHAWRALGELRAEAAIEPLLTFFDDVEEDDWVSEELPQVFGLIGPSALPALTAYLADPENDEQARIIACEALFGIAQFYPDARPRVAELLTRQLMRFADQPEGLNGFLIFRLASLRFTRAESLMRLAFKLRKVDEFVTGTPEMIYQQLHETAPAKVAENWQYEEKRVAKFRKYLPA